MPAKKTKTHAPEATNLALIYARVSSKKQLVAGDGLNSQLTVCLNHATVKGYEICGTFTDDLTGSEQNRPGLLGLMAVMRANPDKRYRIVFDHINRLVRDTYLHSDLRRIVDEHGGILESPSMIYGDDSSSRLVENMTVAVSTYQRQHNMEQTNSRMRARLENGYAVFAASAGYKYGKVSGHGGRMLVRNEPVAAVVVEALEGYASGLLSRPSDVTNFLQDNPLFPKPRTGRVPHQRVSDMLRNPAYAGLVGSEVWGIPLRAGHHEPLISVATFQRIQDRLRGIDRAPSRKLIREDFPLRGFVMCDDCGHPLTACWSNGSHAKHPYYLCPHRGCESYGKSIRRSVIEGEFESILRDAQPQPQLFAMAAAMFRKMWARRQADAGTRLKALKDELVRVERQVESVVERIVETSVPSVIRALEQKVETLDRDKLLLREKIAAGCKPEGGFDQRLRTALWFLASPCGIWTNGRLEDRQAVLKLTFADRLRYKRGEGFRTANLSLPFKVLDGFLSGENGMARPKGFEPLTPRFVVWCSIQLSYGRGRPRREPYGRGR